MGLYDGYKEKQKNDKRDKIKKMIVVAIIAMCILIVLIIALIIYIKQQPNKLSVTLDGKESELLLKKLKIDIDESTNMVKLDEKGKPVIYAPIKEIAETFNYEGKNGKFSEISSEEDTNSCNLKGQDEIAIFTVGSNKILKKDITQQNSIYESYQLSENVFKENDMIYTSTEGMELAFNILIFYNDEINCIEIYTLDCYLQSFITVDAKTELTPIEKWGYNELSEKFANKQAILDDMLIVQDENKKYGAINSNGRRIINTQYDSMTYIPSSKLFIVENNSKFGIISSNGTTKIKTVYDKIKLIDTENQLYEVSENNLYGVINIKGNEILPTEYTSIGIESEQFMENDIINGYVIQEKLIPVEQDEKWGLYNLSSGKIIGEGVIYDSIGCNTSNVGTAYNVVSIPEYKSIIVQKEGKYGCINLDGDKKVGFKADDVYLQISEGEKKYIMSQTKDATIYTIDISELIK